ncbi:helix-turn-helix domain-containing protein [Roseovarius sp. D0-M9]|uniref:helix-turn-helix domain-containing protein n=1 Tax=Roseovarius sp. D0-M9 TaxID=3127117 RepID=UPI0030103C1A
MEDDAFVMGLRRVFEENQDRLKPARVSADAGLDKSTIRKLLSGGATSPKTSTAYQIARALNMTVEEIIAYGSGSKLSFPTVSIAGRVGAGAQVPVFDAYEKGDGPQVVCPPGLSPHDIVAVEIEGESMEPVYSAGDVLFYTRQTHEGVPAEALGRRCVCEDADGDGWVKVVREGRNPGTFDLHSFNDTTAPMYGVHLRWATPVRLHWPADLVRRV